MAAASALSRFPVEHEPQRASPASSVSEAVADKVRIGGSVHIRIVARTMRPWMRPGDQVFVRRYDFSQITPGNIVLYERANRLFIHRVIRRITRPVLGGSASFLIVKGDALDRPDAPVSAQEFLGRAIRIHRGNRHIDLESFSQTLLGTLLQGLSRWTRFLYRPLRSF